MASSKDVKTLLDLYVKMYEVAIGTPPVLNRFKEKWGMMDVLDDLGLAKSKEILTYYMATNQKTLSLQVFYANYDKLVLEIENSQKKAEHDKKISQETKERAARWKLDRESRSKLNSSDL